MEGMINKQTTGYNQNLPRKSDKKGKVHCCYMHSDSIFKRLLICVRQRLQTLNSFSEFVYLLQAPQNCISLVS